MRIVIASLSYFVPKKASVETYLEVIAKGFKNEDVHVIALSDRTEDRVGRWGEKIHLINSDHGIKISHIGILNPLIWSKMFYDKLCELKPDVVITGEIHITGLAAAIYSKLFNKKSIITVTGDYEQEKHNWWKGSKIEWFYNRLYDTMEFFALKLANHFVSNGRHVHEFMQKKAGTDRCTLSFGSTEPDRFVRDPKVREEARKKLRLSNKKVIGFIGNFLDRDGIMDAIDVIDELIKTDPSYHLLVLGDGPLKRDAYARQEARGLNDAITWLGWVHHDEVSKYLQACDLVIFPMHSPQCGLSMAALESMALEIPIMTTDVGDMKELVREGRSGFLVGGTVDSFVEWIKHFFSFSDSKKGLMGLVARKLVEKEFSDSRMTEDFRKVIDG